jgi:hypothetical protein
MQSFIIISLLAFKLVWFVAYNNPKWAWYIVIALISCMVYGCNLIFEVFWKKKIRIEILDYIEFPGSGKTIELKISKTF